MVAKIKSGKSIIGALNYNENKVKAEKAILIEASGFAKDHADLTFYDKLLRLTDLADRNQLTKTNTLHLSLNFDVSERLDVDMLRRISEDYMEKIGFGTQPYLVYQHLDAGHPHVHILTTNIKASGERISLHNNVREKSEPARKAIEKTYGLVQAEMKIQVGGRTAMAKIRAVEYGETDLKRSLTNVVSEVVRNYKFTSLPELNAALKNYNVLADRGSKQSVMFKQNGLRYWILDLSGRKQGVPIKASSLYGKPTLKLLEDRFKLNEYLRKPLRNQLISRVDVALAGSRSKQEFETELGKRNINILFRQNDEGRTYGVTFVDQINKAVFNGSDLGKAYSASALMQILSIERIATVPIHTEEVEHKSMHDPANLKNGTVASSEKSLLADLLDPVPQNAPVPWQLKKKKKKKLNL